MGYSVAALLTLPGRLSILVWSSGLEAQSVELRHFVGRGTGSLRLSTLALGLILLGLELLTAGATLLAA